MPAVSKKQARFFGAIAGGSAKNKPKGLSKKEAKEFLKGIKYKDLPEKASSKKKAKDGCVKKYKDGGKKKCKRFSKLREKLGL